MSDDTATLAEMTEGQQREKRYLEERAKVGEGWHQLLDDLHEQLRMLLGDYDVLQIKEQYGGLRFYVLLDHRYANVNVEQAIASISDAERASWRTCEGCGEAGHVLYHAGWYKTLCDKHHEELEEIMASAARAAARQWLGVKEVQ